MASPPARVTAFITPIEREDVALLSDSLDVVVGRIEGVLHRIYFCNIKDMRELHVTEPDALQVIAWRDAYTFLEYCADSCEHVAGMVDSIILKNS